MDAPLALYRRYRPHSFDEVIGQSHVTQPLQHALANNRVHHAYLFSGPRGCGKTTCARILARQLNGHTGAANADEDMDIIEIDAASHGGVDDARDLRERAFFAPVNSPYKIYIIDEAHMVSSQGFNALLKLVEEPPPHLKFIFATTEPDKVIGTIRSRTHHYPFRLVPPKVLSDYLVEICAKEQVTIEPTALPLVVRAGAGSVRDTLSVLDQLLGGAGPEGVTYELATALLGYTPDSLLDEAIDAFAAGDGGSVFGVVDKVMEIGQDPRRFAEDLLQRLRDLVIVSAVPGAIDKGLLEIPGDRAERIENQAARFGGSDLTRAADVVSQGLLELRGATAPRLLLELVCARILLPGADHSTEGFQARLDRIERRLSIAGDSASAPAPATPTPAPAPAAPVPAAPVPAAPQPAAAPPAPQTPDPTPPPPPAWPEPASTETPPTAAQVPPQEPTPEPLPATEESPAPASPPAPAAAGAAPAAPGALGVTDVRRLWPEVLDKVMQKRRFAWIMLSQNAQVHSLEGQTLTIAMVNAGARDSFARSGSEEILRQALFDVIGGEWRIETVVDPSTNPSAPPPAPAAPPPSAASNAAGTSPEAPDAQAAPEATAAPDPRPESAPESPQDAAATPAKVRASAEGVAAARESMRAPRTGQPGATAEARAADSDAAVDRNDPTAEGDALSHEELLSRELGAQVIEEFPSS